MATFSKRVVASADDGYLNDSFWSNDSSNLIVGRGGESNDIDGVIRITDVTIPQASIINSATVTFRSKSSGWGSTVYTKINGFKETNTATFSTNPMGRSRTTANVTWNFSTPSSGVNVTSASIVSIIQEIVDQGGWVSGNALGIVFENNNTIESGAYFSSYDDSTTLCALLTVDYTAPGSPSSSVSPSRSPSASISPSSSASPSASVSATPSESPSLSPSSSISSSPSASFSPSASNSPSSSVSSSVSTSVSPSLSPSASPSPPDNADYGIKIAKDGKSIYSTDIDDYVLWTKYPPLTFLEKKTEVISVTSGGCSGSYDIAHTYDFIPLVRVHVSQTGTGGDSRRFLLPATNFANMSCGGDIPSSSFTYDVTDEKVRITYAAECIIPMVGTACSATATSFTVEVDFFMWRLGSPWPILV